MPSRPYEIGIGPIPGLRLPWNAWSVLKRENITTLDQLRAVANQLERFENIGVRTATLIRDELARAASSGGRDQKALSLAGRASLDGMRPPLPEEAGRTDAAGPGRTRQEAGNDRIGPDQADALRQRAETVLAETSILVENYREVRMRIANHIAWMREVERELRPVLPRWAGELRMTADRLAREFGPGPAEVQSGRAGPGPAGQEHRPERRGWILADAALRPVADQGLVREESIGWVPMEHPVCRPDAPLGRVPDGPDGSPPAVGMDARP